MSEPEDRFPDYPARGALEQGCLRWTQATAQAQAGLVHPAQPAARGPASRLGAVRPRHRQQAPGLRPRPARSGQLVINAAARHRATIVQQKTGKPVQFELTEQTRDSLIAWLTQRGGGLQDFVFPSRIDGTEHISTRQYARLVGAWVESIGLGRSAYGTHSLRRTKVALIYKRTGNLRAAQILPGHTKLESTIRFLGVDAEDALTLSEAIEV